MTALLEFAISTEYRWNVKVGRFQYRDSGKFAPREAVLNLTRATVDAQSRELVALGDRLSSGKVTLKEFQVEAATLLRQIHIGQTTIAKNGLDKVTAKDWLATARTLKTLYYQGKDSETGKPYGLKHLSAEIAAGTVSPAQLAARLKMYANSGGISYWASWRQAEKDAGRAYGIRKLGATDDHCPDCVAYAAMVPRAIEKVTLPKTKCQCRANCLCTIVGLTATQANAMTGRTDYSEFAIKRDAKGRFAKTNGTKTSAISQREQQIELLADGGYKSRLRVFDESDRKYQKLSGEGKTYNQLKDKRGKEYADQALEKHLKKLAREEAVFTVGKGEATLEHDRIKRKGSATEKAELEAFQYFHVESEYTALSVWKAENPEASKTLVSRHQKEKELNALFDHDAIMARGKAAAATYEQEASKTLDLHRKAAAAAKLKDSLLARGQSREESLKQVAQIETTGLTERDKVTALSAAVEFYQLSGGEGKATLERFERTDSRAYANRADRSINVGSDTRKDVIWHEMGHHLEFENPRIAKAAREWRDRRATGEEKTLNEITGKKHFDPTERALPGDYITPYVGKTYYGVATEVVSMGMQFFAHPQTMVYFHNKAPDHFYFMLGLLNRD